MESKEVLSDSPKSPQKLSSKTMTSIVIVMIISFLPGLVSSSIYYQKPPLARFASQSPPACTYQGVKYQNGDQVVTSEPCLNCTCKRGVLSCFLKVCPTIMFHPNEQNCPTVREPGACCPVVKCAQSDPSTTTTAASTTIATTIKTIMSTTTAIPVPSTQQDATSESSDSRSRTESSSYVPMTSPVPVYVGPSSLASNYYLNKNEELNNYTQNVNDVLTSYSSLPMAKVQTSTATATTTPGTVNGLLSDVNGLSVAASTGLKVASAAQLSNSELVSNANKYTVSIKDNTTIFETSPATIVQDSPKYVTSSVTSQPDLRSDPSENELLESGGCSLNGTMYAEGSAVIPSSFCEYCYCIRGRRMCIRPRCHLSLMDCLPRYTSEYACCPTSYACGVSALSSSENSNWTTLVPTTTTVATTTSTTLAPTTSSSTQVYRTCREKGSQYRLGEKMTSNKTCQNCYCSYGGVKKCRQIQCSPPISGCTPITPPGHCCPTEYKCSNDSVEKHKQKPNVRKEEEVMPILDSDGVESTTDSISLNDFTTTLSPPLLPVEVSSYKLRGQPNVDVPSKESVALDPIEDGASSIDDPVANSSALSGDRQGLMEEIVNVDNKEPFSPENVHNDNDVVVAGKVPIASTIGPVLGSAINSELEDAVEKREEDDHLQVVTDALQLYTLSPAAVTLDQETSKKEEHGPKDGESLKEIKSTTLTTSTTTTSSPYPTPITSNNGTSSPKTVTEVITLPPNTHLNSMQHSTTLSEALLSSSSAQKSNLPNPSSPEPPSPLPAASLTPTTGTSSPFPPPTSLPELAEVKIQPNVLYSSWKSGSSASAPSSNEVNEDRDRVEIILDGIIHALDQRLNEELPSEPRVEDKNKKVSSDENVEERKEASQKTVTSRKEDTHSFELPPLLPTGYITNLDQSHRDTQHKDNPSSSQNPPTIPSSLLNSAFGKIVHVSSMIGFASDSPRKPEAGNRKPDTHSVRPGSASFMVVDDPSPQDYKKGSVFDGSDSGGVEIITAKTPFLEADNISDSDSFLVNLSPTTLKVGSSSPYLYSPGASSSSDSTYESLSPWSSNNRAPIKPMASFPTYYGSSTNQWKIVSQNHAPTGKSPKSDNDSLYYSEQSTKRTGQLSPTSEAFAKDPERRASRLEDSIDSESSFHSPSSEYRMKVLSFASNDGLGHQPHLPSDSSVLTHQHFRKLNGSSFARVRVPVMTGNNANHPYQVQSQSSSCLVDGKEYPNGAMIPKKLLDPCNICGCFNGREMCQPQTCPLAPSPQCKSEMQPGNCCPRFSCHSLAPEASALQVSHSDPSAAGHEKEISVQDLLLRAGIPNLPPVPSHVHGFQARPPPMQLDPTSTTLKNNPFPQPGKSPNLVHFPPEMISGEPYGPSRPPGMFLGTPTNAFLPPNKHGLPQGPPMIYNNKNQGNRQWNINHAPQNSRSPIIGPFAPSTGHMSASSNIVVHQEPPMNYSPTNTIQLSQKANPYPYNPTTNKVEAVPSSTSATRVQETASSPPQLSTVSTLAVDTPDKTVLELIMNAAAATWETNTTQVPPSTEFGGTSSTTTTASTVLTSEKPIWKVSTSKQLIFSGSSTTAPTISTTSTTSAPTTSKSSNPWDLLRVSGCNIYGTFYNVDESINELSTACKKCFCSSFGVQCSKVC